MFNIRALARGAAAPLRSPGKPPLRQRSRLGSSARPPAWPKRSRRPGAGCSPADHRSPPVEAVGSRMSLRRDRRAAWSALPPLRRRSPRPPGRDYARPSSRGRAPFPTRPSPVVRGVTRPGPALGEAIPQGGFHRSAGSFQTWPQTLVHPRTFGVVDLHPVQETRTDKGTTITVCDVRLLLSTPYNIVAHRAIGNAPAETVQESRPQLRLVDSDSFNSVYRAARPYRTNCGTGHSNESKGISRIRELFSRSMKNLV